MSWIFSRRLLNEYLSNPPSDEVLCVSSHCSQEPAEDCSQAGCLGGEQSAQLSETPTQQAYLWPDRTMSAWSRFPSGMTCVHLTDVLGEELLMSFLEAFRASHSQAPPEAGSSPETCGQRCSESCKTCSHVTCLLKTSQWLPLKNPYETYTPVASLVKLQKRRPPEWVLRISGNDSGCWLPTPTTKNNASSPSMAKWPSCRSQREHLGGQRPSPNWLEWMMGWPIKWTALDPLETGRFLQWQLSFGLN